MKCKLVVAIYLSCLLLSAGVFADIADGPISYWPLDEGQGTYTHDMVNNNDGVLNGNPQWVTGVIGEALDFDGNGDYVACGDSALLRPEAEITVQAWINVDTYSYYAGVVANWHDTSSRQWRGPSDSLRALPWPDGQAGRTMPARHRASPVREWRSAGAPLRRTGYPGQSPPPLRSDRTGSRGCS